MGSLSSFSKTSRKVLLLFLGGVGRLRCGGDGEERGLRKASGMEVQCRTWDWEGMVRAHAQGSDRTAEKT